MEGVWNSKKQNIGSRESVDLGSNEKKKWKQSKKAIRRIVMILRYSCSLVSRGVQTGWKISMQSIEMLSYGIRVIKITGFGIVLYCTVKAVQSSRSSTLSDFSHRTVFERVQKKWKNYQKRRSDYEDARSQYFQVHGHPFLPFDITVSKKNFKLNSTTERPPWINYCKLARKIIQCTKDKIG